MGKHELDRADFFDITFLLQGGELKEGSVLELPCVRPQDTPDDVEICRRFVVDRVTKKSICILGDEFGDTYKERCGLLRVNGKVYLDRENSVPVKMSDEQQEEARKRYEANT